ncbi:MAG: ABC transporter ATP-binding protein [Actinomycetota bacterium]|nr:ABC transporter ATP-binding protein [Actinomycetota bacterium]
MADEPLAVELTGITKTFPGVIANEDVELAVGAGTIHAIVGENGAGKSTLMKILYGMQSPDEGTIRVRGHEVHFKTPKEAIAEGIGMVHQHFMLADNFTVLENIVLGSEPTKGPQLDFAEGRDRINEIGTTYGMEIDPDALVETLTVGARQRTEIVKVLYRGAKILILDEPTAVLVPQEVDELFKSLREFKEEGESVIFISHHLDEVLAIADSITVMRGGRTVATVNPDDVDAKQLAELMVGSELPTAETTESTVTDVVELSIRGVEALSEDGRAILDDVTFDIHQGEIVGIAGVEGNGQTELIDAIMGIQVISSGAIEFKGDDIADRSTKRRRKDGIGIIPADRHRQGLLLQSPLWENAMLGHQTVAPFSKGPWIDRKGARERTTAIIDRFDVKTPGPDVAAIALSGGNQQKLIVGKEMIAEPNVLIAAHPTRGIDVGAQAAIWDELRDARKEGLAVLLISADLEELIGLSDRLLVIFSGRIVAELDPQTVTPDELGSYMTGVGAEVAS